MRHIKDHLLYMLRSKFVLSILSVFTPPVIWLLLKTERLIWMMNWPFVKAAMYSKSKTGANANKLYKMMASHLSADRLSPQIASEMRKRNIAVPASLAAALVLRHTYNDGLTLPEKKIYDKLTGMKFARALGLKVPEMYIDDVPFDAIVPRSHMVVKPIGMYGARGVFVVRNENDIFEINSGKVFRSWDSLQKHTRWLLNKNIVEENKWMAQQFICDTEGNVAMDLKFFVFYGKVAMTAEMIRYPRILCDFRDSKGRIVQCNLYGEKDIFKGPGASNMEWQLAEKVSLEIPSPFVRIDFLRGVDSLYFGEFTTQPAAIGQLTKKVDHQLGVLYCEAEARLAADLIAGKKFELFNQVVREVER